MVNKNTSIRPLLRNGLYLLLIVLSILLSRTANAQEVRFGIKSGLSLTKINSKEDSGLKVGAHISGVVLYPINKSSVSAELQFSTAGQQLAVWEDVNVKEYYNTSLFYINIPVLYQYYFANILGLEIGPQFGYCLSSSTKMKTGNSNWIKLEHNHSIYNPFDFGAVFGVFTKDLLMESTNNLSIGLRIYTGFTNVFKDRGSNKNFGVYISLGYIL